MAEPERRIPGNRVMNGALARLLSMTAIESSPSRKGGSTRMPVPEGAALTRRAALDLSIDDELVRGELRGSALPGSLRRDLAILVHHELTSAEPLAERRFLSSGFRLGLLAVWRRRRLDMLIEMSLARRERSAAHATVAGIAAVLRPAATGSTPPRELLRTLRLREISAIRR